jgi:CBS domain-containing protein
LRGKKSISVEDVSAITSLILERISSLPHKPISELYIKSEDIVTANSDSSVIDAVTKMMKGGFTQLPVMDVTTGNCLGIITDFTILKRMLSPNTTSKENWLNEFKKIRITDAEIIDEAPTYPLNTPIAEIGQALLFHYAILILESRGKIGIVTRADFQKMLL